MNRPSNVIIVNEPWQKPLPNIDEDNAAFWEGLRRHTFLLWRCRSCGAWYWPKAYCRHHANEPFAANMEWTESSGRGKVFAFNTHHAAFDAGFRADGPFVYALIELEEGPLVSSTLIGERKPKDVYDIGQRVEVVYEDHPAEGFTLPRFRIVD